jgi:crossover junction endodeoxyribonuclease RusA
VSVLIELGWPTKALSPNYRSRSHWPRTRALQSARKEGYLATVAAMSGGGAPKWSNERFAFVITAYPPDRRDRDDDNLKASLKGHRDGIAQALGVDDSRFDERFQWGEPVKGGKIVVEVRAA